MPSLRPRTSFAKADQRRGRRPSGNGSVDIAAIENALSYLAELIETRPEGDAYWPIFDRLDRERELRLSRVERLRSAETRLASTERA